MALHLKAIYIQKDSKVRYSLCSCDSDHGELKNIGQGTQSDESDYQGKYNKG